MKSTGVTRKIDELGRIVIPKEIRKNLGIRDGESLEIFTENDSIILKKHFIMEKYEQLSKKLCESIYNIYKINVIITDREKVIASSFLTDILKRKINEKMKFYIDNREMYISGDLIDINFDDFSIKGYVGFVPIIVESDSLGLVILVDDAKEIDLNLGKFIAKLLVDKIDVG